MKHKHSEVIKAFVDGIECEYYYYLGKIDAVWLPIINLRDFDLYYDVRIKPEPQKEQEQEPQYLYVYNDANRRESWMSPTFIHETYGWNYMGKVRVEK